MNRNSVLLHAAASFLSSVLNFVTFSWLLKVFGAGYIGDLVYYQSIAFGLLIVWNLGLNSLIVQQKQKDLKAVYNTLRRRQFLVVLALLVLFGSFWLGLELFLTIFYSISLVVVSFASTFLYSKGYAWFYLIYTNIGSIASLLMLVLVFGASNPLIGRIGTLIISNLCQLVFFIVLVFYKMSSTNSDEAYDTKDSLSAFLAELLSYGVEKTDKLFLRGTVTASDYGLYSAVYQLGTVFGLVSSAVSRSFIGSIREVDESWITVKATYFKYLAISLMLFLPLSATYIYFMVGLSAKIISVLVIIVIAYLFDSIWKLESTELALKKDVVLQSKISIYTGVFALIIYAVAANFSSIVIMALSNLFVYIFGYVLSRRFAARAV